MPAESEEVISPISSRDQQRLRHASGYLELDLPDLALGELNGVEESLRSTFDFNELMGEALRAKGDHLTALRHLDAALRIQPEAIDIMIAMGWCLKRIHALPRAIEILHAAEQISRQRRPEGHGLVMYNLACYYSLAHNKPALLEWLGKALHAVPGMLAGIAKETDFDPFRQDPDFLRLLQDRRAAQPPSASTPGNH